MYIYIYVYIYIHIYIYIEREREGAISVAFLHPLGISAFQDCACCAHRSTASGEDFGSGPAGEDELTANA